MALKRQELFNPKGAGAIYRAGRASGSLPLRRCGGANRRAPQAPRRCNERAVVRSIACRRLLLSTLAKRRDPAPKARSPGNAAMRWRPDIEPTALPTPARALSRCQIEHETNRLARRVHAAATTSRHVRMADALKARCVLADVR